MKRFYALAILIVSLLTGGIVKAQTPTFATDIAPIVYSRCTPCHNPAGVAAFMPFNSYQSVSRQGMNVMQQTMNRNMPPWPPDHTYSRFLRERFLTQLQINKIADWVSNGMPRGDSTLEPVAPVFQPGAPVLGQPDTVLAMSQAYTKAAGADEYRIFVLPFRLPANRDIAAIEFVPGNTKMAHHAIIALDTTGRGRIEDNRAPGYGYPSAGGGFGFSPADFFWATWVPGATPIIYPTGTGKKVFRNTDLLVQMHYGPTSQAMTDSSFIRIYYARTPIRRYYQGTFMNPLNLINGNFVIPPNTVRKFVGRLNITRDLSMIDVSPHAHLICKSWKSYAVVRPGDTIPLLNVPNYNFHWQGVYTFQKYTKIPRGSQLFAEAVYDNTVNNPNNPSRPPQTVTWGEQTTDEMFLFGYSFVDYEPGDENISLENNSLVSLPVQTTSFELLAVYPNPATDVLKLRFTISEEASVSARLYDMNGRLVTTLLEPSVYAQGHQDLLLNLPKLPKGVYTLSVADGRSNLNKRVVISE